MTSGQGVQTLTPQSRRSVATTGCVPRQRGSPTGEVAAYNEERLAELIAHVADEIDRFRQGRLVHEEPAIDWWERGAFRER